MPSKPLVLIGGVAAVVAAVLFFLLRSGSTPVDTGPLPIGRSDAAAKAGEPDSTNLVDAGVRAMNQPTRAAQTVERPSLGNGNLAPDHPWAGDLAGVTGRLVEEDGTPVPGLPVELFEVDIASLLKQEHSPLGLPSPEVDQTVSGPDGRFVLDGARISAYHALSIGRETGRATIRVIEQALENGARVDLGDIVLPAFGTLVGVVIDEDGEPVPGARVRAAPIPRLALDVGTLDIREGIAVFVADEASSVAGQALVFEVPDRVFTYVDRLPIPTTYTAQDGSFKLEGVTPGSIAGGADMIGHVAGVFGQVDLEAGEEVDLGEIELLFGRTVSGRVTDLAGDPIQGAEVLIGATLSVAPVAILHSAGVTDENGRYEIEGIPENGKIVGAARRTPTDPWLTASAVGLADAVDFKLLTANAVTINLTDLEGEPVRGASIRMRSVGENADMFSAMIMAEVVGGQEVRPSPAEEAEPGVYLVNNVTYGSWQAEINADGFADVYEDFEHRSEGTTISVRMSRGALLRVTAIDAATKEPIANVHATLVAPRGPMFDAYDSAFTDATGLAELGPLPDGWYDELTQGARSFFRGISIVAEHPRYGKGIVQLDQESTDVFVEMPPSCTVEGRVHWAGEDPPGLYMLALRLDERAGGMSGGAAMGQMMSPPRTALSNQTGSFRFTGVAPGRYSLTVMERWLEGDPITLIVSQTQPVILDDRPVDVRVGDPAFIDVELSANGQGPTGRFVGRITANGAPVQGLEVKVQPRRGETETILTNGRGEFESAEYATIESCNIEISGDVPMPDGSVTNRKVFDEWRRPVLGEPERIDIDLSYQMLVVRVTDVSTGAPVAGVTGSISSAGERRFRRNSSDAVKPSGADGLVEVVLPDDERYRLVLEASDYATARIEISADDLRAAAPHRSVEMQPAVVCKGTVVLPEGRERGQTWIGVRSRDSEDRSNSKWVETNAETREFEVKGLMPGEYTAELFGGGAPRRFEFRLGPNGDEELVLDFTQ